MTPTSILPAATQAIETQKCGDAAGEIRGAVDRIDDPHRTALARGARLVSSPMNPSLGKACMRREAMSSSVSPSTSVR